MHRLIVLCLMLIFSLSSLLVGPSNTSAQTPHAPFFISTMTHMEASFIDDRDEAIFWQHIEQLRYGMDLADEYGAKLTIESEKPFARANTVWEHNMLQEILDRGHGVGTHCDIGYTNPAASVEDFALQFAENKRLVDELVGAENNRGCSGGGGTVDYVLAASMAGFEYLDGIVGMHYLSMPLENRPDSSWTDDFIRQRGFHDNAPVDLARRIHPFIVSDATDFIPDEDGVLLISSGEVGRLDYQYEDSVGQECGRVECAFTTEDTDALVQLILEANALRDTSKVAKVTVYLPAAMFDSRNEVMLRYFFSEMQRLVDDGTVTWATQGQIYDAFLAWNNLESLSTRHTTSVTNAPPPTTGLPPNQVNSPCGDGVCNGPENSTLCPEDCPEGVSSTDTSPRPPIEASPTIGAVHWVTNPTSGAKLYVEVIHPPDWDGSPHPTLVMVPGGIGTSESFRRPNQGPVYAKAGYVLVIFDFDGRGQSEGVEDYGGTIHQDGLAAVIQYAATLPEVDATQIGLISFSYGVTSASGVLARYPDLPIRFLMDWEGPANRLDTGGCGTDPRGKLNPAIACDDEAYWAEREASTFIAHIQVPYQRVQSQNDHVQSDNDHALTMINNAINGGAPWVRLNDLEPNQTFDLANPPQMLPENLDRQQTTTMLDYLTTLFSLEAN